MKLFGNKKTDNGLGGQGVPKLVIEAEKKRQKREGGPAVSEESKQTAGAIKGTSKSSTGILGKLFGSKKTDDALAEPMSNVEYLGEIYKLLKQNQEDIKFERQESVEKKRTDDNDEENRHKEIIKALTLRRQPTRAPRRAKKEEKPEDKKKETGKEPDKDKAASDKTAKDKADKAKADKDKADKAAADKAKADKAAADKAKADKAAADKAKADKDKADKAAADKAKADKEKELKEKAKQEQLDREKEAAKKAKDEADRKAKEAKTQTEKEAAKRQQEEAQKKLQEAEKAKQEAAEKAAERTRQKAADEARKKAAAEEAKKKAKEEADRLAEEKGRKRLEEETKKLAEKRAKKAAEEKAKKEAEEKAKKEAEEKAKKEAEEKLKKETAEKLKKEEQEKLKKEAEEKSRLEKLKEKPKPETATQQPPKPVPKPDVGTAVVITGIATAATGLVPILAKAESPDYNLLVFPKKDKKGITPPKPLTKMTIDEVIKFQSQMSKSGQYPSNAVGKYQIIQSTLKGGVADLKIPLTQLFDEKTQDRLYYEYLTGTKRKKLGNYLTGEVADKPETLAAAQLEMAKEFASFGVPYRVWRDENKNEDGKVIWDARWIEPGQSYYVGSGGNKASVTPEASAKALREERALRLKNKNISLQSSPSNSGTQAEQASMTNNTLKGDLNKSNNKDSNSSGGFFGNLFGGGSDSAPTVNDGPIHTKKGNK